MQQYISKLSLIIAVTIFKYNRSNDSLAIHCLLKFESITTIYIFDLKESCKYN